MGQGTRSKPLLVAGWLLYALCAAAQEAPAGIAPFAVANDAYRNKDYESALKGYESLLSSGVRDSTLYYNAGCALAQLGRRGRAAAKFESALRLNPRLAGARKNLHLVAPAAPDGGAFFLFIPFKGLFRRLTGEEFFLAAMAGYWMACIAAGAWLCSNRPRVRHGAAWTAALAGIWAAFFGVFCLARWADGGVVRAIIVADGAVSRSGPSENYSALDEMKEGLKIRVFPPAENGWIRAYLPTDRSGYVQNSAVEIVE